MAEETVEYLVVAPHPDDAELGMGGTIAKLVARGGPGRAPRRGTGNRLAPRTSKPVKSELNGQDAPENGLPDEAPAPARMPKRGTTMAKTARSRLFLAALLALALTAPAVPAAGAAEVGQPAPAVAATDWLNAPPLALEALRGKVVVVEFWATWCPPCRATIPHLVELDKKYRPKGVVIMGLTNEPKSKVEPFARQMGMTYAVGCGSPSAAAYGVRGIPHAFVLDPSGKIVWHGHPAGPGLEAAIQEQLRTNPPTLLSPKQKAQALALVEKAAKAVEAGKWIEAAGLLALLEHPDRDPEVAQKAAPLRERLLARAKARLAETDRLLKRKAYYEADAALAEAAALAPGTDLAETAQARRTELLKDETARAAIEKGRRARAAAEALARLEAEMEKKRTPPAERLKAYEAFAAKHAGTPAGAQAAAKAQAMRADKALMARLAHEAAERDSKGWLSMARNFIRAGFPEKARPYLLRVIEKYPDTDFADQARTMLEELKKK